MDFPARSKCVIQANQNECQRPRPVDFEPTVILDAVTVMILQESEGKTQQKATHGGYPFCEDSTHGQPEEMPTILGYGLANYRLRKSLTAVKFHSRCGPS